MSVFLHSVMARIYGVKLVSAAIQSEKYLDNELRAFMARLYQAKKYRLLNKEREGNHRDTILKKLVGLRPKLLHLGKTLSELTDVSSSSSEKETG